MPTVALIGPQGLVGELVKAQNGGQQQDERGRKRPGQAAQQVEPVGGYGLTICHHLVALYPDSSTRSRLRP